MIEQPNKNRASFLSQNSLKILSASRLLEDFCCDASRHPWVTGWRKRRVLPYTSIVWRRFIIDWVSSHGWVLPDHIWESCGICLLSREEQSWTKEEKVCGIISEELLRGNSGKWGEWSVWKTQPQTPRGERDPPDWQLWWPILLVNLAGPWYSGIKSLVSPELAGRFFTTASPGKVSSFNTSCCCEGKTDSETVTLLSRIWLFVTLWTVAYQAPPSMGFSRQEYWSGFPFPSPWDLPNPGIYPRSPTL